MYILWMLLIGIVIGALVATLITPVKGHRTIIVTLLLGVVGSLVGGSISRSIGHYHQGIAWLIASNIGAFLLIVIYRGLLHLRQRGGGAIARTRSSMQP